MRRRWRWWWPGSNRCSPRTDGAARPPGPYSNSNPGRYRGTKPIDVTLFRDLPTEGWPSMERYADELTAALSGLGCDARAYVPPRTWPRLRGRANALVNYAWRTIVYPLAAPSQQRDLNHILDHSYAHLIRALDPRRTIVTCHDIAPLTLNQRGRGPGRRLWDRSFQAMLGAAHIITASAFTRAEILRVSDYPAGRITPIGYGVAETFRDAVTEAEIEGVRRRLAVGNRHLVLHVGSCEPRKNIEALLYALAELRDLELTFVQVGGRFSRAHSDVIRALGLAAQVTQVGPLFGSRLYALYQAADIVVLPSLYEGFGWPILEAMAAGTPVVCSNTSSVPEVAGEAALMVDPRDSHALPAAIRSVLTDPDLRRTLVEKGRARSFQFSWAESARRTLQVYTSVYQSLSA